MDEKKPRVKWNHIGSTTDGLRVVQDDRQYIGGLVSKPPKYDPLRGSPREYVWVDDANCNGVDPELFQVASQGDPEVEGLYGKQLARYNLEKAEQAMGTCEGCPVKQRCLDEATPGDLFWSVRGGELPERLAGEKVHVPTFDITGYDEPWSCAKHGKLYKRSYQRRKKGVEYTQVYCQVCYAG